MNDCEIYFTLQRLKKSLSNWISSVFCGDKPLTKNVFSIVLSHFRKQKTNKSEFQLVNLAKVFVKLIN